MDGRAGLSLAIKAPRSPVTAQQEVADAALSSLPTTSLLLGILPTQLFSLSLAPGEIFSTHDDQTHGLLIIPAGKRERRGEEYRGGREGEEIERGEAEQGLRLPARFYVKLVIPNANLDIAVNSIKERFTHLNGD